MRRLMTLVFVAIAAVGMPVAEAEGRSGRKAPCSLEGSKTIAAGLHGRVFARRPVDYARVYGCLYARNRRVPLGRYRECFDSEAVSLPRLAGRFAGFALDFCHRAPTATSTVVVKNLRSGRTKFRLPGFTGTPPGVPALYGVTDLELKPNGSVAWIVENRQGERQVEVRKADAEGRGAVLDSGTGIDTRSLALSESRLYWLKDGRAQSALLR
jgi:hypothetical protein